MDLSLLQVQSFWLFIWIFRNTLIIVLENFDKFQVFVVFFFAFAASKNLALRLGWFVWYRNRDRAVWISEFKKGIFWLHEWILWFLSVFIVIFMAKYMGFNAQNRYSKSLQRTHLRCDQGADSQLAIWLDKSWIFDHYLCFAQRAFVTSRMLLHSLLKLILFKSWVLIFFSRVFMFQNTHKKNILL